MNARYIYIMIISESSLIGMMNRVLSCKKSKMLRFVSISETYKASIICRHYYKYLGVDINEKNLQECEINNMIAKYIFYGSVGMLYPLLKSRHVPRDNKLIIYKTILKPILIHGHLRNRQN